MSKAKHTPGDWKVMPEEVDRDYIRIRGTEIGCRYKIANVMTPTYPGVHEREVVETRANAKLIATAPELLAALQGLLAAIVDSDQRPQLSSMRLLGIVSGKPAFEAIDAARAAIRKATGE